MTVYWPNSFTIVAGSTGAIFTIMGLVMKKWPPKKINDIYGYRTRAAKKSQIHWDFAQTGSAVILHNGGLVMMLSAAILLFFPVEPLAGTIAALLIMFTCIIWQMVVVEKALKKLG